MEDKSIYMTYFLWLIGGWISLHHLYLRRDKHAFVYWCTFGGYLGIGLLRDFVRIPEYVQDANNSFSFVEELTFKMRKQKRPPFALFRFVAQILVANSWTFLCVAAVPGEPIMGVSLRVLLYLSPIGTALGVWLIGNIGRIKCSLKWPLIGAFIVLPLSLFYPPIVNWSAVISALMFEWKGKEWRRTPYEKHTLCRRFATLSVGWLCFCSLWLSYLYFNAEITDKEGQTTKFRDALQNFFNSPMFLEFKATLGKVFSYAQERGYVAAFRHFIELLDPSGQLHALKVLSLAKNATQEEITARYKQLTREWHPDRHKDPAKKAEANEKFIEIGNAYEILSEVKRRRNAKSKVSDESTEGEATEKVDE